MSFRIAVYNETEDGVQPIFEQRIETLDLQAVFKAINGLPRKRRSKRSTKPEDEIKGIHNKP
jgi:hypothetical protein